MKNKKVNNKALQVIPGIGPSISKDLNNLRIYKVSDLIGKNPEILYEQLEQQVGTHVDRCVLYIFRCAIYFAEHKNPDPEKLIWWNWKDKKK